MREGDPLDVQADAPEVRTRHKVPLAGIERAHRELYVRGFLAGLASPVRARRHRLAWLAVLIATAALALSAFQVGRVTAAPRPAAVIPSDALGAPETDQQRTGAPSPAATAAPPRPSGAPSPTGGIGEPLTGTNPDLTPEPVPTQPPTVAIRGSGIDGQATWFAQAPYGTAAAGPRLRRMLGAGWRGTRVSVSRPGCECPPVVVVLTDWCACTPPSAPDRIIDLDDQAFAALAPLSFGVIDVTVVPVK